MKPQFFSFMLRFAKVIMWLLLISTGAMTTVLIGKIYDAASTGEGEIRLRLNTFRPNLGEFWHAVETGWADGSSGHHPREERGPLPALPPSASFKLVADPNAPLMRYREPSASKRVALLALGASDDSVSVAGLIFLGWGSWLLLGLLRDVSLAMPFTQANAQRLRELTLLIIGLGLWQHVAYALVWKLVPAYRVADLALPLSHYVRLNTEERIPSFQVGFILSIITIVYKRGIELSQEAELVI